MKWTVVWQPEADDRLAELWNAGPDRAAIAHAANQIDWALKRDPEHHGEAREDNIRILIVQPLAVYFTVSQPDCLVSVVDVWRWGPKP